MRKEYDFSAGHRGAVLRLPPGKTRITIRIDDDILKWFRRQVDAAGGGNYQTSMNAALREYITRRDHKVEDTLRVVIREELRHYEAKKGPVGRKGRQRVRH
ncbi:MAG TPA: BrnA antitoxin family protein [Vicinamibacteria bacterium]|nr:BrnA antitoxin family protein [Vicinamibacteria bacterium]